MRGVDGGCEKSRAVCLTGPPRDAICPTWALIRPTPQLPGETSRRGLLQDGLDEIRRRRCACDLSHYHARAAAAIGTCIAWLYDSESARFGGRSWPDTAHAPYEKNIWRRGARSLLFASLYFAADRTQRSRLRRGGD